MLVVDNGGRADEACVGDLAVLEAQAAPGWRAWWCGACTATRPELAAIGLPVFSYGCYPAGPVRLDRAGAGGAGSPRGSGRTWSAPGTIVIFGDDDGVLFVAA